MIRLICRSVVLETNGEIFCKSATISVMGFSSIKLVFDKPTLLEKPYFITSFLAKVLILLLFPASNASAPSSKAIATGDCHAREQFSLRLPKACLWTKIYIRPQIRSENPMEKADLIVNNATIITMNKESQVLEDHSLVVKASAIAAIEPSRSVSRKYESSRVIDGRDQYIFPGFINTHTHLFQNGLKGLGRDKSLFDWLDSSVRKAMHEIRYPDVYNAAVAGCIENMRSGVTTVLDYMYAHGSQTGLDDAVVQAFDETGIRGILGRAHTKTGDFPKCNACAVNETEDMFFADVERLVTELKGHARITLALAPSIIWDMGEPGYHQLRRYADHYGLRISMHLDESREDDEYALQQYGVNAVELLDRNGVLGEDFIGVHLVQLDEKSLDILQKRRIKVSHNPVSNMVLASGVAPIPELKKRGLDIGLGTDGAASNDTQNMLEVIKTAAILHKCVHRDATLLPAIEILKMATCDGAKVVG